MTTRTRTITNGRTKGASPKVIGQALATLATFALARYGVDLGTEESGALSLLVGAAVGAYLGPGVVESR